MVSASPTITNPEFIFSNKGLINKSDLYEAFGSEIHTQGINSANVEARLGINFTQLIDILRHIEQLARREGALSLEGINDEFRTILQAPADFRLMALTANAIANYTRVHESQGLTGNGVIDRLIRNGDIQRFELEIDPTIYCELPGNVLAHRTDTYTISFNNINSGEKLGEINLYKNDETSWEGGISLITTDAENLYVFCDSGNFHTIPFSRITDPKEYNPKLCNQIKDYSPWLNHNPPVVSDSHILVFATGIESSKVLQVEKDSAKTCGFDLDKAGLAGLRYGPQSTINQSLVFKYYPEENRLNIIDLDSKKVEDWVLGKTRIKRDDFKVQCDKKTLTEGANDRYFALESPNSTKVEVYQRGPNSLKATGESLDLSILGNRVQSLTSSNGSLYLDLITGEKMGPKGRELKAETIRLSARAVEELIQIQNRAQESRAPRPGHHGHHEEGRDYARAAASTLNSGTTAPA